MKIEEKELLAMHKEIEDELEENKYISRKISGIKDDSLTIRIPKRKTENQSVTPKKKVLKKKRIDQVPVKKKQDVVPMKKKKSLKKKSSDPPKKKTMKKKKKKITNPEKEEEDAEPMEVEQNSPIPQNSDPDDTSLLVDLLVDTDEIDQWDNLEVPWKFSYYEREERYEKEVQSIQHLSLEQRMKRYLELIVLGKGGREVDATEQDRAVIDFFSMERARSGSMFGAYADLKGGKFSNMCDYISTLGAKITDFEAGPSGSQEDCYFKKKKLKKADAWVCTITMEVIDENGKKSESKSKKYVHKKLVPILQAALFIVGFDVSIAGQVEDFVRELDQSLTLDEIAKAVGESDMVTECIQGLKYSIKKIADTTEWMEGFIDDCWKD